MATVHGPWGASTTCWTGRCAFTRLTNPATAREEIAERETLKRVFAPGKAAPTMPVKAAVPVVCARKGRDSPWTMSSGTSSANGEVSVDLGGRRIIRSKSKRLNSKHPILSYSRLLLEKKKHRESSHTQ